jgi:hypothetical protein
MKKLLSVCSLVFICLPLALIVLPIVLTSYAQAAEIISSRPAKEVKTYTQDLTMRTTCEVEPARGDRDGGEVPAYCSCIKARIDAEGVIKQNYPTAHRIYVEPFTQPIEHCGKKTIDVSALVVFTVQ